MSTYEIIMGVIAIALLIAVIALVRLSLRLDRTAQDVSLAARKLTELTPNVRELIDSSRAEVEALRKLTAITSHVASDVRTVSGQASAVTSQLLRGLESEITDRYRALFSGARAGVEVLRRHRSGNGSQQTQRLQPHDRRRDDG